MNFFNKYPKWSVHFEGNLYAVKVQLWGRAAYKIVLSTFIQDILLTSEIHLIRLYDLIHLMKSCRILELCFYALTDKVQDLLLFRKLGHWHFTFTALHSADKFSNEQQIFGLNSEHFLTNWNTFSKPRQRI